MFEFQATILNPVCISKVSNVRTMLFIPRERERLLQHSNCELSLSEAKSSVSRGVYCLWELLRSYYSTVEMVIPKPTSTTTTTYLRLRFYSSSYYYMVPGLLPCDEKCASVLEKFRAKKRSPKKTQILRKIPHLWLTSSSSFRKKEATSTEVLFWVYGQIESRSVNLGNGGTAPCCITNLLPITT